MVNSDDFISPDKLEQIKVQTLQIVKKQAKRFTKSAVIVFFDLCGSTKLKLQEGHTTGVNFSLYHNMLCHTIVQAHNGSILKDLGDGTLAEFATPLSAVLSAIDVKRAFRKPLPELSGLESKISITFGVIEKVVLEEKSDAFGNVIDQCAKINSVALPGQILIDNSLRGSLMPFLKNYPQIILSPPYTVSIKGLGKVVVSEVSTNDIGLMLK